MAEIISLEQRRQNLRQKPSSKPSSEIIAAIEKYFAKNNYKCKPIDEHGILRTNFSIDCKLKDTEVVFMVETRGFNIHFILPIGAGQNFEDQLRVAEFLSRANYGMRRGCFELDFSDGEIRFREAIYGDRGFVPSQNSIETSIALGLAMCEVYGDALLKVLFDVATPKEAIVDAESKKD